MPHALFHIADGTLRERVYARDTVARFDRFNWCGTELGEPRSWPEALKGAVRAMMLSPVAMALMIGPRARLVYNDGYAVIAGPKHPEIFGLPVCEAWPEIADFTDQQIARASTGETVTFADQELTLNRTGELASAWFDLTYSPILDDDGKPLGVLAVVIETTERVVAERRLRATQEKLEMALGGSLMVGTWDWDIAADRVTADPRFAEFYGIDPVAAAQGIPIARFVEAIHPDDHGPVRAAIEKSIAEGGSYRSEYRVLGGGERTRWVLASGQVRRDESGTPTHFPGVAVDITEQKLAAAAAAESEARFRILADTMPQMVWATRPDGFHDYYNARWYEFTGTTPGSTDGEGWAGVFHPEDQPRAWGVWREALETGEPYHIEYRLRHHSGVYRWVLGRALPIRDETGTIQRWIGTCTDIDDSKRIAEEREVVAQELSHRIKNIFAVVTAIVGLSARTHPEMREFAEQLRQRILALGKAHDFVRPHSTASRPVFDQNSLFALVAELLKPYCAEGDGRLVFEGEDAPIDDGPATPLALIFHELATNSAKYGALAHTGGQVTIRARGLGERYHLTWKETGVPTLGPGTGEGFGSRLMKLSVEGQLQGSYERHWDADGLRVEIEVPLSALRRSMRLGKPEGSAQE
ncbi:PAS domain S-box protein [Arsenicitalea aurantiaca]|uniref:Blue-light-activated histidine kinase n=1 Tax=Arsenicitalea aurantiaca TaxID=1783274 RepID=A0A433XA53_9HYPH|nr:PAS domain-containing protein [Arsenicitalea aurantiaca]RUT30942.1 PAS domain S-box protein [Arsenicitalea aurantiaca]